MIKVYFASLRLQAFDHVSMTFVSEALYNSCDMIDSWKVLILFSELNPLSTSAVLTLFVNINLTSSKIALMESGDVCGTSSFYFLVVPQKSVVSDNQTTTKSSPVAHMTYLSPNWGWFLPKCDIHVISKIWVQKLLPVNKLTGVATGRRTNPATIKNRPDLFLKNKSMHLGCRIWHQIVPDYLQMWQICHPVQLLTGHV